MVRRKSETKHFSNKGSAMNYLSFLQKPYQDSKIKASDRSFPLIDIPHHHLTSNKSFNQIQKFPKTPPKAQKLEQKFDSSPYLKKQGKLPKILKKQQNSSLQRLEKSPYQREGRNIQPLGNIRVLDYFQSGEQSMKQRSLEEEILSHRIHQKPQKEHQGRDLFKVKNSLESYVQNMKVDKKEGKRSGQATPQRRVTEGDHSKEEKVKRPETIRFFKQLRIPPRSQLSHSTAIDSGRLQICSPKPTDSRGAPDGDILSQDDIASVVTRSSRVSQAVSLVQDYQMRNKYYELGGLGPNLGTEQHMKGKAKLETITEYSKLIRKVNLERKKSTPLFTSSSREDHRKGALKAQQYESAGN